MWISSLCSLHDSIPNFENPLQRVMYTALTLQHPKRLSEGRPCSQCYSEDDIGKFIIFLEPPLGTVGHRDTFLNQCARLWYIRMDQGLWCTDVPHLLELHKVHDVLMYRSPRCTLVHNRLSRTLRLAIWGIDVWYIGDKMDHQPKC